MFGPWKVVRLKKLSLIPLLLLVACAHAQPSPVVTNLKQVRPNVWRMGQPETQAQWAQLAKQFSGRQATVIKLNFASEGSDEYGRLAGFRVLEYPIEPRTDTLDPISTVLLKPDTEQMRNIEDEIRNIPKHDDGRVWLIHCVHGEDRTGLVVGMVRVLVDGWTKERAFQEMRDNGFHLVFIGLDRWWNDFNSPK